MTTREFESLMQTIAEGWNTKNARLAADCFTEDAIYTEPPDKQLIQGRKELYEYFGGDTGFAMTLEWHYIFFNEAKQMGAGEYTFEMNNITHHGVAIVELENGKIKHWREYDTAGNLSFAAFLATEGKKFQFTIADLKKE